MLRVCAYVCAARGRSQQSYGTACFDRMQCWFAMLRKVEGLYLHPLGLEVSRVGGWVSQVGVCDGTGFRQVGEVP